jgi:uncharacterized protein (DUF1697 family)
VSIYIALLRGINVGGSGLLPMKDLAALCEELGFTSVRTYIQSGNVIFESNAKEEPVRAQIEKALEARMGKKIDVMVRTPDELRAALEGNPFPDKEPAKVAVAFLLEPPLKNLLKDVVAPGGEEVHLGRRALYIYYPDGMGRSKLKLPRMGPMTVRNINTVGKLVAMADAADAG